MILWSHLSDVYHDQFFPKKKIARVCRGVSITVFMILIKNKHLKFNLRKSQLQDSVDTDIFGPKIDKDLIFANLIVQFGNDQNFCLQQFLNDHIWIFCNKTFYIKMKNIQFRTLKIKFTKILNIYERYERNLKECCQLKSTINVGISKVISSDLREDSELFISPAKLMKYIAH